MCTACSIARLFHNPRDHIGIYGNGSIRNLSRCRACAIEIEGQSIRTSSTQILTGVNRYRPEIGTYRTHYRFISRATRRRNDLRKPNSIYIVCVFHDFASPILHLRRTERIQTRCIIFTQDSGSSQRVEYAVKMPGVDGSTVWLPIDSKFPGDTYAHLQDAQASGDAQAVENARHALELVLRSEAKDIREKYVEPPYTTTFGILFLPFEGLYAEVVNAGLLEVLQRDYQVNVAGPSTMAALLNSLQMGFKTLAIQKRSGEVWQLLGAVKTEFDKFGQGLSKMQQRLRQTDEELDNLIGVRSRAISRKLRSVQSLDEAAAATLLELDAPLRPLSGGQLPQSGSQWQDGEL